MMDKLLGRLSEHCCPTFVLFTLLFVNVMSKMNDDNDGDNNDSI